jgi:starch-binding outer membrane protein, SusD/RagB family
MNNLIKTLKAASLLVLIMTSFSNCKKFLDRKPLSATLSDLNQGGLEGQAIGLYGAIRNSASSPYCGDGFESIGYLPMQCFRSGDQTVYADPGAGGYYTAYTNFQYSKDDWADGIYWDRHYQLIYLCNQLKQTADSLKLTDDNSLINVAEAKWFRAYSYFDLVKNYGQVPLVTNRVYTSSDAIRPKSTIDSIYMQIDSDLNYAEQYLPLNWSGTAYTGRLTSGAARTLHAKTWLMRPDGANWANCLAECQAVIASGQYTLFTPYWSIWKLANENCSESIFEVQCQTTGISSNNATYWSWWGTSQGVRGSGDWNLGWGWNNPMQSLVSAYETGDPRKAATILFSDSSDDPANGGYGLQLPNLTNSAYWNKKVYTSSQERLNAGSLNDAEFVNQRVLRYADVILMAAECENELGDGADAATYLEQIRSRARNGAAGVLPSVAFTSQTQMRAAIKQERRVEFGMEMERFYDLVRWGDAQSVLGGLGFTSKNIYYPIPTAAITAAGGALVQNPNY